MGLCGVFACCISGFVTSHSFSNKVQTTKCVYERVYYDSINGEIKKEDNKWEGLNARQKIIDNFTDFLYIKDGDNYETPFDFKLKNWEKGNKTLLLNSTVYYSKDFQNELTKILSKCWKYPGALRDLNGELICDSNLKEHNSYIYGYINEVTKITKYFSDEVNQINDFINKTKKGQREKSYDQELIIINNTLKEITEDLDNYKNGFLDKAYDYIKVSNICGYILVTIYYSILLVIVVCSCFLLWAYSFFKEQRLIYTFMHFAWNILKFFSFSFFMFGAAFGALYLISRDLIGYNQFLFSDLNLAPNVTTYLLPNGATKEFLRYCINEEDSNYINNFKYSTFELLSDLYFNMQKGKDIKEDKYNFSQFTEVKTCYYVINENLRNIEGDLETDTSEIIDTIPLNFTKVGIEVKKMINEIYQALYSTNLRLLEQKSNIIKAIEKLGETIEKLNCGFLKTEIQILYDSLYELSIESRISCALCCCIGFFIEFSVAFYLLVLYHYNKIEFRDENDTQKSFPKNRNRKFDLDSQNEFMDKSRPPNLKRNNKKLDLEFNFN